MGIEHMPSKQRTGFTSKYIGVCWREREKKWRASFDRKVLGHFDSEEEAARCWNDAQIKRHGVQFALQNVIE